MPKVVRVDFRRNAGVSGRKEPDASVRIRAEKPGDEAAVRALNEAAFGSPLEADIVDALRAKVGSVISLVAELDGNVVGHIVFSPVSLLNHAGLKIMGLGPLCVASEQQRKGIGAALVRAGLERCERLGCDAVVVVGHASYYPRFGFGPAAHYGLRCEYDVPEDVFMALELHPGALNEVSGLVQYDAAFGSA
jgi:putative acetyltransferase